MKGLVEVAVGSLCAVVLGGWFFTVSATRYTSTSYVIDASVMNNAGGTGTSSSYALVGSAGESIVGNGASGSYKMGAGYVAQLEKQASSFQLSAQPSDLLAYYAFDESSGSQTADYSQANIAGTLNNSPTRGTGQLGQAVTYDGVNQSTSIGNTASYSSSKLTVSAWIKTSVGNATLAIVAKPSNFYLVVNWGRIALYDYTTSVTCSQPTGNNIADGTWHYVAMTLDSGVTDGSTVYLDGAPVKTCTWTPQNNSGNAYVGQSGLGAAYFNGSIDEVKIFSRTLTPQEIMAEYSAQLSGTPSGLSLGQMTPGSPTTTNFDILATSAGVSSYSLAAHQNHDLQKGSDTIPAISASIASPAAWADGTTKGLGFTVLSSPTVDVKWNSGANYAAFPATATTYYTRSSPTSGVRELTRLRVKLDTASTVPSGDYANTVTITGTSTP